MRKINALPAIFLCISSCSSDRIDLMNGASDMSVQNVDVVYVDLDKDLETTLEEQKFIDENTIIDDYSLPLSSDRTSTFECPDMIDICSAMRAVEYLIFGEIVEISPLEDGINYTYEYRSCDVGNYKHVVITLHVMEEFKKEKPISSDTVKLVVNELAIKDLRPTILFDDANEIIWYDYDKGEEVMPPFGRGDVIGLLAVHLRSNDDDLLFAYSPFMRLTSDLVIDVQKEMTCWTENQFQGLRLHEIRSKINKCKIASKFDFSGSRQDFNTEVKSCR